MRSPRPIQLAQLGVENQVLTADPAAGTGYAWRYGHNVVANVKDFGAAADGATDDAPAFQAAIASLPTDAPGGGIVYVPAGEYVVASTIAVPTQVTLRGEGTGSRLRAAGGFAGPLATFDLFHSRLENLYLDCHGEPDSVGVSTTTAQEMSGLVNVWVQAFHKCGLEVDGTGSRSVPQNFLVRHCVFGIAHDTGFPEPVGIYVKTGQVRHVMDTTVTTTRTGAGGTVYLPSARGIFLTTGSRQCHVKDTHLELVGRGIDVGSGQGHSIDGVTYYNDQAAGTVVNIDTSGGVVVSSLAVSVGAGGAGHMIVDSVRGYTLPAIETSLGVYTAGGFAPLAAAGLKVVEGEHGSMGTAVLSGTTPVAVTTSAVGADSRIMLTVQSPGGTVGTPLVHDRTPGTGFTVCSTSADDTSTVAWLLVDPA